jgi:hypothetical protein
VILTVSVASPFEVPFLVTVTVFPEGFNVTIDVLLTDQLYVTPTPKGAVKICEVQIIGFPVITPFSQNALQFVMGGFGGGFPVCVNSCAVQSPFLGKKPICCSFRRWSLNAVTKF